MLMTKWYSFLGVFRYEQDAYVSVCSGSHRSELYKVDITGFVLLGWACMCSGRHASDDAEALCIMYSTHCPSHAHLQVQLHMPMLLKLYRNVCRATHA